MHINIDSVNKSYGKREILKNVSLFADPGECIGILGANGSGKSTLLAILAGVLDCESGSFCVGDNELLGKPEMLARTVGYVPQGAPLFEELTARDNLRFWYKGKELEAQLESGVLLNLGIDGFIDVQVRKLSGGMKKRLLIGCALSGGADILLMDEPTSALDLVAKYEVYNYIDSFCQKGGTVFITTHDEREISRCNRCYLLKNGEASLYEYDGDSRKLAAQL